MPIKFAFSDEDLNGIKAQFKALDKNDDGKITVAEIWQAFCAVGQICTVKDVQRIVMKVDTNGDGRIVWEEFLAMMAENFQKGKEEPSAAYDEAMQAFKLFDKNNDGMIDIIELKGALKELRLEQDPAKVEALLKDLDRNGDGHLNYIEFGRLIGI